MTTTRKTVSISKKLSIFLALFLALPIVAAAASQPSNDQARLQKAAENACRVALCAVSNVQRRDLGNSIAEYTVVLRVGAGPNDLIGLHRVVREEAPFRPARAQRALFMTHGDIWGFDAAFLADPANALPVFLARNGVDVWGIDLRWVRVPATATNFTFMKNWGIEQDARDVAVGLSFARATRLITGNGSSRLTLLGWSRGGIIGYAYLNAETQLPPGLRNVKGFIPVDIYLKTDDEGFRQNACNRYAAEQAAIEAGTYQSVNGTIVLTIASLATSAPNGSSPIFPGLTNRQAALLTGEATFLLLPPDGQPVPSYHFTGGTFAAPLPSGLPVPTGLLYSSEAAWLSVLRGASPFQPQRGLADSDAAICGTPDVRFDDHLARITVPVLYVGAGGGFGEYGVYTTTLLGSTDVTTRIVDLKPAAERLADFGHADLFIGRNAQSLVWQPILSWLRTH